VGEGVPAQRARAVERLAAPLVTAVRGHLVTAVPDLTTVLRRNTLPNRGALPVNRLMPVQTMAALATVVTLAAFSVLPVLAAMGTVPAVLDRLRAVAARARHRPLCRGVRV
ncbi:hypothetical protein ADK38_30280, partial [Streptomyces varsoviensis]